MKHFNGKLRKDLQNFFAIFMKGDIHKIKKRLLIGPYSLHGLLEIGLTEGEGSPPR
jgi:hypothetical protein